MTVARAYAVISCDFVASTRTFRSRSEIKLQCFPSVAPFGVKTEARGWYIAAMGHAILTARIARPSIHRPVLVPIHFFEQLSVGLVMAFGADGVGHEIAGRFPTHQVASRNGPGRTSQIAMAGEKLKIDRRAKKSVAVHPLYHPGEFLDCRFAGEEEILGLQIEPFHHVFFGCIIIVARRDSMAVNAEISEEVEHLLDLAHVGFLVDRGVSRDLVAEALCHLYRENAFLEHAFAFDDEIVRPL